MKNRFTIFMVLFSGILFLSLRSHNGHKNSGQAPIGRTGAPSESTCAACHSGGSYSGEMSFSLGEKIQPEYEPGQTYTITFIGEYDAPRYGFSMTVLDESDLPAGAFTLLNSDNTSLQTGGSARQYVGHKNANTNNSWTFQWTAPEQAVGNITFYYVINAADGNNGTSGDYIETGSTVVFPAEEPVKYVLSLSSNPAGAGSLSGAGEYEESATVNVSAVANPGYLFVNWTDEDTILSEDPVFDYVMPASDKNLVANFIIDDTVDFFTLTFEVMDEENEPVLDAVITFGTIVNEPGDYVFELAAGFYDYKVEKEGFVTFTFQDYEVTQDETINVVLASDETGIDYFSAQHLRIFPNPASEVLKIELDDMATGIKILDMSGRIVFESQKDFKVLSLNVSSWQKGIYLIIAQTPNGQKTSKVLIGN
ncbi:MAG: T9SS C-terminal target domain-containing protein [Bacteroidetes bacterium]|nr:MAG: T9SS C-terminal target domain-containing protein [Bacteroidota bacterium]